MTFTVPSVEPDRLVAGVTWKWTLDSGFDPATWTLSYALVRTAEQITFSASDNGDGTHLVNVAAATTAGYGAGLYRWQSFVSDGSDRHKLSAGEIEVVTDYAGESSGFDGRSHVKTVLDALEATIAGKATSDQLSVSIGDASLSRMSPAELIEWHSAYQQFYRQEQDAAKAARGFGGQGFVRVRF